MAAVGIVLSLLGLGIIYAGSIKGLTLGEMLTAIQKAVRGGSGQ